MKRLLSFLLLFSSYLFAAPEWIVYYNNVAPPEDFLPYNPIVFDAVTYPDLKPLLEKKKTILGYLDLAEISPWDDWYAIMNEKGILIEENINWKKSYVVDLRSPDWKHYVLTTIIPKIFEKGFTGIFLDQIDMALALEEKDPAKYKGMRQAAIDFVLDIKKAFPGKPIMINRAYSILPEIGGAVDFILSESLSTNYDFETKKYSLRKPTEVEWQVGQVKKALSLHPHLIPFALDYCDVEEKEMVKKIYAFDRSLGFRTYVSTIQLDTIVKEPQ